jgi:hypothetical protein
LENGGREVLATIRSADASPRTSSALAFSIPERRGTHARTPAERGCGRAGTSRNFKFFASLRRAECLRNVCGLQLGFLLECFGKRFFRSHLHELGLSHPREYSRCPLLGAE